MTVDALAGIALILILSVAARLIASLFRIPAIMPLLVAGVLVGGVTGMVDPQELFGKSLTPIVSVAVAIILFEGALRLRWADLADGVHKVVIRLVTIGVAVTWALGTLAVLLLFDFGFEMSLLIGAILIVSGPTVVLPMLDFIRPSGTVRAALRWEGILIDPIGAITAVIVFGGFAAAEHGAGFQVGEFVFSVIAGGSAGAVAALALMPILESARLSGRDKVAAGLMMVVVGFAIAEFLFEDAGLVAAIVTGLILANQKRVGIGRLVEFSETLVPLLLGALFLILSANVDIQAVVDLGWEGVLLVALFIVLIRPLAALLSGIGSQFNWRERAFLGFMAPKGIVAASTASVFGLQLTQDGIPGAEQIVPVTFLVVAGTVFVYGVAAPVVGRALGVAKVEPPCLLIIGAPRWVLDFGRILVENGVEVKIWAQNELEVDAVDRAGFEQAPDPLLMGDFEDDELIESVSAVMIVGSDDAFNHLMAAQFTNRMDPSHVYIHKARDGSRKAVNVRANHLATGGGNTATPAIAPHMITAVKREEFDAEELFSIASITFGRGNRPAHIQISTDAADGRSAEGDLHIAVPAEIGTLERVHPQEATDPARSDDPQMS